MFTSQGKIKSPDFYRKKFPLTAKLGGVKKILDDRLRENFISRKKLTVVCGPCSADYPDVVQIYLDKLKAVANECENLLIVARIYTSKPHSNGVGYKGAAFHLTSESEVNLNEGIARCREMMLYALNLGLSVADELLYPELFEYFKDLVGYWFVGARSSEDALHRCIASGLDVCCGIKNPPDGSVDRVVDSLYAVSNPCVFPYCGKQVVTDGCKFAHVVLRGGLRDGAFCSNIGRDDILFAKKRLVSLGLNDFVMADLNHANSGKVAANQIQNAQIALNSGADGVMIESYLHAGSLSNTRGTSQTDDCLDFESTEKVLKLLNERWRSPS